MNAILPVPGWICSHPELSHGAKLVFAMLYQWPESGEDTAGMARNLAMREYQLCAFLMELEELGLVDSCNVPRVVIKPKAPR
jgi:hypothetical protein